MRPAEASGNRIPRPFAGPSPGATYGIELDQRPSLIERGRRAGPILAHGPCSRLLAVQLPQPVAQDPHHGQTGLGTVAQDPLEAPPVEGERADLALGHK
jgi:hypothetical protein